jgi:hypothetical protein
MEVNAYEFFENDDRDSDDGILGIRLLVGIPCEPTGEDQGVCGANPRVATSAV